MAKQTVKEKELSPIEKIRIYESEKLRILMTSKTHEEYEDRIRDLCTKLKI